MNRLCCCICTLLLALTAGMEVGRMTHMKQTYMKKLDLHRGPDHGPKQLGYMSKGYASMNMIALPNGEFRNSARSMWWMLADVEEKMFYKNDVSTFVYAWVAGCPIKVTMVKNDGNHATSFVLGDVAEDPNYKMSAVITPGTMANFEIIPMAMGNTISSDDFALVATTILPDQKAEDFQEQPFDEVMRNYPLFEDESAAAEPIF